MLSWMWLFTTSPQALAFTSTPCLLEWWMVFFTMDASVPGPRTTLHSSLWPTSLSDTVHRLPSMMSMPTPGLWWMVLCAMCGDPETTATLWMTLWYTSLWRIWLSTCSARMPQPSESNTLLWRRATSAPGRKWMLLTPQPDTQLRSTEPALPLWKTIPLSLLPWTLEPWTNTRDSAATSTHGPPRAEMSQSSSRRSAPAPETLTQGNSLCSCTSLSPVMAATVSTRTRAASAPSRTTVRSGPLPRMVRSALGSTSASVYSPGRTTTVSPDWQQARAAPMVVKRPQPAPSTTTTLPCMSRCTVRSCAAIFCWRRAISLVSSASRAWATDLNRFSSRCHSCSCFWCCVRAKSLRFTSSMHTRFRCSGASAVRCCSSSVTRSCFAEHP
mmetsp:Transcript_27856/g.50252  ORF Transcript_27856/g.50252 Transcript_27856/m.50252 type:complete len:385 (-) Transcript_27856:114-1268(-)